jgi:hypothetical protein
MEYNAAMLKLEMPARMRRLPIDERGYPVPAFVAIIDGKPDFRVVKPGYVTDCIRSNRCWLCGEQLGKYKAFVIGPMCAVNRVSSEPPSHLDCARFACVACPFLTQPKRPRNPHGLPEEATAAAGLAIPRNPGVTLLWVTNSYRVFKAPGGILLRIGPQSALEWYAHGRAATRDEVLHSIETGIPTLRQAAAQEGHGAMEALEAQVAEAMELVPA